MSEPVRVCVVIPVRNEAAIIDKAIDALAAQTGIPASDYSVLVLANNCDDDSAAVAQAAGDRHPRLNLEVEAVQITGHEANIGRVRSRLMNHAAARLTPDGVIASTDGDTVVDPGWLAATLREIDAGADMVGGRIFTGLPAEPPLDPATRRAHLNDTLYRLLIAEIESLIDPEPADPWPRHFQHFSASLAVTVRAYRAVGGMPDVEYLEDVALHEVMRRADMAIRHSFSVRVITSARRDGRVPMGLSTQLQEWRDFFEHGRERMVESADFVAERLCARRRLREWWKNERLGSAGLTFGRFADAELCSLDARHEPIDRAIAGLRAIRADLRSAGSDSLEKVEAVRCHALAT